jgi:hypothetical protein
MGKILIRELVDVSTICEFVSHIENRIFRSRIEKKDHAMPSIIDKIAGFDFNPRGARYDRKLWMS